MSYSIDVLRRVAVERVGPESKVADAVLPESGSQERALTSALIRTARLVHPEPTFRDHLARIKYFLRGLRTPRLTALWFDLLQSPELQPLVDHPHPLIYCKLQRPYLHRRLGTRARLEVLQHHYRFIREQLPSGLRKKIFRPGGCILAMLPVEPLGRFSLRLSYAYRFGKEGDLNLEIVDETTGGAMFTLTFSVTRFEPDASMEIFIGGLQGHPASGQKELIIELTRALHGLRPKALLVFALQRLAQLWNSSALHAVSDREHVQHRLFKRKGMHACYDDFWRECHGQQRPDGNFVLPVFPLTRDMNDLPAKKRPVYRRRYEMLEALGEEIRRNLVSAPQLPAPVALAST